MSVVGDLVARLSLDGKPFNAGITKALLKLQDMERAAQKSTGGMAAMFTGVGAAIGTIAGTAAIRAIQGITSAISDLSRFVLSTAASAETLRIQFDVLTGSTAGGAKMFADIERFAIRTAFSFDDAAAQARTFLAVGVEDANIIPTLTLIGTLAMGDAERLKLVGKAYTDTMSKGKLQAQEMRQFAENNVNIVGALGEALGKTGAEIRQMSEDGAITFDMMHNALVSLTTGQGRFAGLLDKMMTTTQGKWNMFLETLTSVAREFGAVLLPHASDLLDWAMSFIGPQDKLIAGFKTFVDSAASAIKKAVDFGHDAVSIFNSIAPILSLNIIPAFTALEVAIGGVLSQLEAMVTIMDALASSPFAAMMGVGSVNLGQIKANLERDRAMRQQNIAAGLPRLGGRPNGAPEAPAIKPILPPETPGGMGLGPSMFGPLGMLGDMASMMIDQVDAEKERKTNGALMKDSSQALEAILNAQGNRRDPVVGAVDRLGNIIVKEGQKTRMTYKNNDSTNVDTFGVF